MPKPDKDTTRIGNCRLINVKTKISSPKCQPVSFKVHGKIINHDQMGLVYERKLGLIGNQCEISQ